MGLNHQEAKEFNSLPVEKQTAAWIDQINQDILGIQATPDIDHSKAIRGRIMRHLYAVVSDITSARGIAQSGTHLGKQTLDQLADDNQKAIKESLQICYLKINQALEEFHPYLPAEFNSACQEVISQFGHLITYTYQPETSDTKEVRETATELRATYLRLFKGYKEDMGYIQCNEKGGWLVRSPDDLILFLERADLGATSIEEKAANWVDFINPDIQEIYSLPQIEHQKAIRGQIMIDMRGDISGMHGVFLKAEGWIRSGYIDLAEVENEYVVKGGIVRAILYDYFRISQCLAKFDKYLPEDFKSNYQEICDQLQELLERVNQPDVSFITIRHLAMKIFEKQRQFSEENERDTAYALSLRVNLRK